MKKIDKKPRPGLAILYVKLDVDLDLIKFLLISINAQHFIKIREMTAIPFHFITID